jgi:hypothetical protein
MAHGRIFGGAKLDQIGKDSNRLTFKDIEGIDQVKAEIRELVEFLKNPKRFIDLGARSPAGVLLVGAPGTGLCILPSRVAASHCRCPLHSDTQRDVSPRSGISGRVVGQWLCWNGAPCSGHTTESGRSWG